MIITDLNREGGIGANSLLVELNSLRFVVDCGLHPKKAGLEALPDLSLLRDKPIDFAILTHCHLDHVGALPVLLREHPGIPVFMSKPSHVLAERMLHNSCNVMKRQKEEANIPEYPLFTHGEIDRIRSCFIPVPYNQPRVMDFQDEEIEMTFFSSGHVAGASGVRIAHNGNVLFFTGDVLFTPQRILQGAMFPSDSVQTLVLETTRGATEKQEGVTRDTEVVRLIETIDKVIQRGGSCLIPVFALGRMQEVLTLLNDARREGKLVKCPVFCSGLGMDLADYFDQIARKTKLIDFRRATLKELKVSPLPANLRPGRDIKEKGIYVVSSGMLVENTPSYRVASSLIAHRKNAICFVGYCDPDTPGGKMLETEPGEEFFFEVLDYKTKIAAEVERFELSGHAERDELIEFALELSPDNVVLTHGDPPARAWFMETLRQRAPEIDVFDPEPGTPYSLL